MYATLSTILYTKFTTRVCSFQSVQGFNFDDIESIEAKDDAVSTYGLDVLDGELANIIQDIDDHTDDR